MKKPLILILTALLLGAMTASVSAWEEDVDYVVIEDYDPDHYEAFSGNYPASTDWNWPECTSGQLLTGTVIAAFNGQSHSWSNGGDNASYAFDGESSTFFDPYETSPNSWCGLILDKKYTLTEVRIMPREGWTDRFAGCAIQGSNNGEDWDTILQCSEPAESNDFQIFTPNSMTDQAYLNAGYVDLSEYWVDTGAYSMYRYINLGGLHGDVAEVELYGTPAGDAEFVRDPASPASKLEKSDDYVVIKKVAPDNYYAFGKEYPGSTNRNWPDCTSGQLLTGTVVAGFNGESHCWGNGGDNASRAFDGNSATFFDPFDATDESWCGLILDQQYVLTEVRIMPRDGWMDRFYGCAIEGSNNGEDWDTILYCDQQADSQDYHIFTPAPVTDQAYLDAGYTDYSEYWEDTGAYIMYRYVNLGGQHGDVAEVELYGVPMEAVTETVPPETTAADTEQAETAAPQKEQPDTMKNEGFFDAGIVVSTAAVVTALIYTVACKKD